MAALHPPAAQQTNGGSWPPSNSTAAPATQRLRDSCHGCAASKLKCSKEKPTCARCAKRGRVCEYFATRRAGRKQARRPSDPPETNNSTRALPAAQSTISTITATTSSTSSNSRTITAAAPQDSITAFLSQHTSSYPDILPSPVFSTDPQVFSGGATPADLTLHDFSDYFDPSLDFGLTTDFHTTAMSIDGSLDNSSAGTPLADNTFSILDSSTTSTTITSPSEIHASTSWVQSNSGDYSATSSEISPQCGCLMHALGLLQKLCPDTSTQCTAWPSSGGPNHNLGGLLLRPIQTVIAENELTIDAVSNMLPCSCSQDGYLLTIIALVVFKTLGQYAAAAREMLPDSHHHHHHRHHGRHHSRKSHTSDASWLQDSSTEQALRKSSSSSASSAVTGVSAGTGSGSASPDGEDQGRIAAQLVLSELHRVQRLVNELSPRLKEYGKRTSRNGSVSSNTADVLGSYYQRDNGGFPFSTSLLDQLEDDLRKGVRALSSEIVHKLRRE